MLTSPLKPKCTAQDVSTLLSNIFCSTGTMSDIFWHGCRTFVPSLTNPKVVVSDPSETTLEGVLRRGYEGRIKGFLPNSTFVPSPKNPFKCCLRGVGDNNFRVCQRGYEGPSAIRIFRNISTSKHFDDPSEYVDGRNFLALDLDGSKIADPRYYAKHQGTLPDPKSRTQSPIMRRIKGPDHQLRLFFGRCVFWIFVICWVLKNWGPLLSFSRPRTYVNVCHISNIPNRKHTDVCLSHLQHIETCLPHLSHFQHHDTASETYRHVLVTWLSNILKHIYRVCHISNTTNLPNVCLLYGKHSKTHVLSIREAYIYIYIYASPRKYYA